MGRKYNTPYKKGKFAAMRTSKVFNPKVWKADVSKNAKYVIPADYGGEFNKRGYRIWASDPRRYDFEGIDTRWDHPSHGGKYLAKPPFNKHYLTPSKQPKLKRRRK